jgi:hypothetical protein
MPKVIYAFTADERKTIIAALRDAAVAHAAFWDVLRSIENREGLEIDPKYDLVARIAGWVQQPASMNGSELSEDFVWSRFLRQLEIGT